MIDWLIFFILVLLVIQASWHEMYHEPKERE
jgi:hypothetical protein